MIGSPSGLPVATTICFELHALQSGIDEERHATRLNRVDEIVVVAMRRCCFALRNILQRQGILEDALRVRCHGSAELYVALLELALLLRRSRLPRARSRRHFSVQLLPALASTVQQHGIESVIGVCKGLTASRQGVSHLRSESGTPSRPTVAWLIVDGSAQVCRNLVCAAT